MNFIFLCAALDTFGAREVKKGLHISARIKSIVLNGDIKGHLMKHSQKYFNRIKQVLVRLEFLFESVTLCHIRT